MDNRIFDIYLRNNLIPSIGGNDEIYKSLLASAQRIADELKATPSKILPYTLVAFDNNIQEGEPVLEEAQESIADEWKMVRSHFSEMPIALYRAVILQALELLIASDTEGVSAAIIYLSIVDIYPYLGIVEKEQKFALPFLNQLRNKAEENAIAKWTIDKRDLDIKVPILEISLSETLSEIDAEELKEATYVAGIVYNSYSLNVNWVESFYDKMIPGLANTINSIQDENMSTLQEELNIYFQSMKKNLQTAFSNAIQSSIAVEQRSQLLWWKETLYSRKLYKSYRKLTKFECVIAMAIDLHYILPNTFPVSVDYILREAFCGIHGFEDNDITFIEFLNQAHDAKNEPFLKQYFEDNKMAAGRTDLASFMTKILYSKMDMEKELLPSIGIAPDREMRYEDVSVWILHCFTVKHLTSN